MGMRTYHGQLESKQTTEETLAPNMSYKDKVKFLLVNLLLLHKSILVGSVPHGNSNPEPNVFGYVPYGNTNPEPNVLALFPKGTQTHQPS
mmetsp:Transcript_7456/g.12752  ORF Transcript_7456/g.12752 Transcript_7456/m.12752 type:complete len:90 (-) Transcript_7456:516-785(-)